MPQLTSFGEVEWLGWPRRFGGKRATIIPKKLSLLHNPSERQPNNIILVRHGWTGRARMGSQNYRFKVKSQGEFIIFEEV